MTDMRTSTRRLVISQGEPLGVGLDLILQAAAHGQLRAGDCVVASRRRLEDRAKLLRDTSWAADGLRQVLPLLDSQVAASPELGQYDALVRATDLVLESPRELALVTAPIDKQRAGLEGLRSPGHTEYLAQRSGVQEFAMLLAGPQIKVVLATIHEPLAKVPGLLTAEKISTVTHLLVHGLRDLYGIARPKVAILGLNPHAGEKGTLGREEIELIAPTVEVLSRELAALADMYGPLPADTAFYQHATGMYDGVVAMYHDQGLAPFKLVHFRDGVNVTLGLPFLRTSPDHGTAVDLAGTGRADAGSFLAAIALARGVQQ